MLMAMGSDGILVWEEHIMNKLKNRYKTGGAIKDKQFHLVGYLFKCCYDVAIAPSRNVSQNPGFESFLREICSEQEI